MKIRLFGALSALLLLAAAVAVGTFLPQAIVRYEDAQRQRELGVYEMEPISLGGHKDENIAERMQWIDENAFVHSFELTQGLNLKSEEACGYAETWYNRMAALGLFDAGSLQNSSCTPFLLAKDDGTTIILWEIDARNQYAVQDGQREPSAHLYVQQAIDDSTGALISFQITRELMYDDPDASPSAWPLPPNLDKIMLDTITTKLDTLADALADAVCERNGFADHTVTLLPGSGMVTQFFYTFTWDVTLIDRSGNTCTVGLLITPYELRFNAGR